MRASHWYQKKNHSTSHMALVLQVNCTIYLHECSLQYDPQFFGNNAILPAWTLILPESWDKSKTDTWEKLNASFHAGYDMDKKSSVYIKNLSHRNKLLIKCFRKRTSQVKEFWKSYFSTELILV